MGLVRRVRDLERSPRDPNGPGTPQRSSMPSILAAAAVGMLAVASVFAAPAGWEADRRLTRSSAESTTSINFARSVAVDERGRVHVVWIDHRDGNPEALNSGGGDDFTADGSYDGTRITPDPEGR